MRHGIGERVVWIFLYIDMTINPYWDVERTSVRMRETKALLLQLR